MLERHISLPTFPTLQCALKFCVDFFHNHFFYDGVSFVIVNLLLTPSLNE
jgi:hypothetical protein